MGVRVVGSGAYLPGAPVGNASFSSAGDYSPDMDDFFKGGRLRHHASVEERPHQMSLRACEEALEDWGGELGEIDALFVHHNPHDHIIPNGSYLVAGALGLTEVVVRSVDTHCNTFITALADIDAMMSAGRFRRALFVCTTHWVNTFIDRTRDHAMVGDGSAALVLEHTDAPTLEAFRERVAPEHFESMTCRNPLVTKQDEVAVFAALEGSPDEVREVKRGLVRLTVEPARQVMQTLGLTAEDFDWIACHQPGLPLLHAWCEILGFPREKLLQTFEETANMAAVNLPYILHRYRRSGALRPGQRLLLSGHGAGMHIAALSLRWM